MTSSKRGSRTAAAAFGVFAAAALVGENCPAAIDGEIAPSPPNVILIYLEDTNLDLGTFGHPVVQTPHLDRLARHGLRFQTAYCPYALCNPSRAAQWTGLRPTSTHVVSNESKFRGAPIDGVPTLASALRRAGWVTGGAGKLYHELAVDDESWDEYHDTISDDHIDAPSNPVPEDDWRVIYWGPYENGPDDRLGRMSDTHNTDSVLDMIDRFAGRPFFVSIGYKAPHSPYIYPERYHGLYDPVRDVPELPPEESGPWREGLHPNAYNQFLYLDPRHEPEQGRREATVAYWRTLRYVDDEIGRILDRVQERGLQDDTIIAVLSDHGFSLGRHGRFGKIALFEAESRVPLILRVPGLSSAGQVCEAPVETIDLYPTLLELCGLPVPERVDGQSLRPYLEDPTRAPLRPAFMVRACGDQWCRMVRTQRYKFVYWETGHHQLYDLEADPGEYHNLARDPSHREVVAQHVKLLDEEGLLQAAWSRFGEGHPGTRGIPALVAEQAPILGRPLTLRGENSSGQPTGGVLIFGGFKQTSPSPWGGALNVHPVRAARVVLPSGGLRATTTVPDHGILFDRSLYLQLLQLDPGASHGVSFSRGLRLYFRDH